MDSAIIVCRFVHFSIVLMMFGASLLRPLLLGSNTGAVAYMSLDQALERTSRQVTSLKCHVRFTSERWASFDFCLSPPFHRYTIPA